MQMMIEGRFGRLTTAALLGLAGVLGFGGGNAALGAQEQPNACELFSRKEARKILGRSVQRETSITGTEASTCGYVADKDAERVVSFSVGEFATSEESRVAYLRARANARFDGLKVQNVRRLGSGAHWLPETNNFERTVNEQKVVFGELTVRDGRRVYTVFLAPPSKSKARDAIELVISD
jgi:hypothetical protein